MRYYILTVFLLLFSSCIDEVAISLPEGDERLVVFGWLTNESTAYSVKISRSSHFLSLDGYPAVSNASVLVSDKMSNQFLFRESTELGTYESNPDEFRAEVGQSYRLHVLIGTEEYVSEWEMMTPVSTIDYALVNFVVDPNEFEVSPEDQNYYVSAFIQDEKDEDNYFRWKIFVDGELRNLPSELNLFNDEFTNGNRSKHDAVNVLFSEGRQIRIRNMSLTKQAFEYYSAIQDQADNSTFTPRSNPSAIIGNIQNVNNSDELILGYFGASQVEEIELNP